MPSTAQQKITEFTLISLALIVPLLSIAAYRAIVPVCAIAAVIVFFSIGPRQIWTRLLGNNRVLIGVGVLFVAILALSTLWAPNPERGALTVAKIAGSFLFGTILIIAMKIIAPETRRRVTIATSIGIVLVVAFLAIDAITDGFLSLSVLQKKVGVYYGHFWLKSAAAVVAIGIWPTALILWRSGRPWAAFCLIGAAAAAAYMIGANGVTIAILGGTLIGLVYSVLGPLRKSISIGAFTIFAIVILFQPFIIKQFVSPVSVSEKLTLNKPIAGSTLYRLYIWDFVSDRILEKPIVGWGVGAARNIGDGEIIIDPKWGEIGEAVPLHPHNAFLQLQLELGVMGSILSLIAIGIILWRLNLSTLSFPARFAGTGLFFAILFQYSISFSVWSSWWNAAVLFSLAIMVAAWRSRDIDQPAA